MTDGSITPPPPGDLPPPPGHLPEGPEKRSLKEQVAALPPKTKAIAAGAVLILLILIGGVAIAAGGSGNKSASSTTTSTQLSTTTTVRPSTTTIATTTTTTIPPTMLTKEMCTETPPDGMVTKDGNSFTGQCLHFWAYVFQFDAATGPCNLMAKYSNAYHRYNFEYGDAILLIQSNQSVGEVVNSTQGRVQLPPNSCAQLGPIVQGDKIEVWGIALGTSSYETKAGGSNNYLKIGLVDAYKR